MSNATDTKVGADVIASIIATIEALDPAAADVLAIVQGVLTLVPSAITLVEDLIAKLKGGQTQDIAPGVEKRLADAQADLDTPITTPPAPAPTPSSTPTSGS